MPNMEFTLLCDQLMKQVPQAVDEVVEEVAKDLYDRSQKIVPYDTGALSKSGRIEKPKEYEREIIYGGNSKEGNIPYAHRLHEHPEYNFKNGRQGKYLEQPLNENKRNYQKMVADKMRKVL